MRVVRKALTFDDVLLVPAHSLVVPRDVSLKTRLTRSIALNIPLVSAAMDTVTEARLAIAIAQEGGLGIIHKNMTPAKQAAEVAKVKRFESGVVKDPLTIPPTMSVRDVVELKKQNRFSGLPVVEGRRVVGIVVAAAAVVLFAMAMPATVTYVAFMKVEKSSYLNVRLDVLYSVYIVFAVAIIVRYAWAIWSIVRGEVPGEADEINATSGL